MAVGEEEALPRKRFLSLCHVAFSRTDIPFPRLPSAAGAAAVPVDLKFQNEALFVLGHTNQSFYASICICIIQVAGPRRNHLLINSLSPGYRTGGVPLCSCGTVAHQKSLGVGTCDFASLCGCKSHSRSVWLNPLMLSGQSRDFLGTDPSPNSVQFFLRATPPLVRRLRHALKVCVCRSGNILEYDKHDNLQHDAFSLGLRRILKRI